jgi:hypothetical protein
MKKCDVAKKLRMILYEKVDPNELSYKFERVLDLCGCEDYNIEIMEDLKVIIVDVPRCIQYIKVKRTGKIYEVIPIDSPIQNHLGRTYYDKEKRKYVKESASEEWKRCRV